MARKFTAQKRIKKNSCNIVIASSIEHYTLVETPIMNISSWKIYFMFVCYWWESFFASPLSSAPVISIGGVCLSRLRISGGDTVSLLLVISDLNGASACFIRNRRWLKKYLKGFSSRIHPALGVSCYLFRSFRFYFPLISADYSCRYTYLLYDISKLRNDFTSSQRLIRRTITK